MTKLTDLNVAEIKVLIWDHREGGAVVLKLHAENVWSIHHSESQMIQAALVVSL